MLFQSTWPQVRLMQMGSLLFCVMQSKTADWGSVGSNKCLSAYLGFAWFCFCLDKRDRRKGRQELLTTDKGTTGRQEDSVLHGRSQQRNNANEFQQKRFSSCSGKLFDGKDRRALEKRWNLYHWNFLENKPNYYLLGTTGCLDSQ